MGMPGPCRISRSSYDEPKKWGKLPNPDPFNYRVIKSKQVGRFLVLMVKYPDCTNYEGQKTMIFEDCTLDDLNGQGSIDPHFCDNKAYRSPIARFEPTDRGWKMAVSLV